MESQEFESRKRLDAFVDAAFAFAVTLLLVAGAEPPQSLDDLKVTLLRIPSAAAAFALIATFWVHHRAFGRHSRRRDGTVLLLSLAIVFVVLVYVYPLRLLTQAGFYWISGGILPGAELLDSFADLRTLYVAYGAGFAILAGLYAALFVAGRAAPVSAASADELADSAWAWAVVATMGVGSLLLALVVPLQGAPWLPPSLYSFIPLAIWLRARLAKRLAKPSPASAEI